MGIYGGAVRLGEIIDRGHGRVEAWLLVGDDLVSLCEHRHRPAGMMAVSAAAVRRRQEQPAEWQSRLHRPAVTDHSPRVVPLRPDSPAPAVRGWHGMTRRTYRDYDWSAWAAADPNGNAVPVDVAPWSPAATAGIMSGDYVVSIDGESLDVWDAHGGPAGTRVHVICYRPAATGHTTAHVVLAPRPARQRRQRPLRPARHPQVASGRRLGAKQRLQWQQAVGRSLWGCILPSLG